MRSPARGALLARCCRLESNRSDDAVNAGSRARIVFDAHLGSLFLRTTGQVDGSAAFNDNLTRIGGLEFFGLTRRGPHDEVRLFSHAVERHKRALDRGPRGNW